MTKYKYETFTVTEERKSKEICTCDVCRKVIFERSLKPGEAIRGETGHASVNFWQVMTGHHDWGNDSCDSVETYDVCSAECLKEKFTEYLSITNGARNSQYFEVEHKSGLYFLV